MTWSEETLGQLCSLITDGKHGDCRSETGSGYFFISCKDVKDGRINYENAREITRGEFEETHRRTDLKPGDVVLTNSGTIGRLAIATEHEKTARTTFQKSVAILKPIRERVTPSFLYYGLQSNRDKLINASSGAAQKNLLLGELRRFKMAVPPISVQVRIGKLLSAYDDLIENNRRRIQLLEQAARLLYKEWFVHLRFPGHEHVKITDSAAGRIPEDWSISSIENACEFIVDSEHKTAPVQDSGIPMIRTPDISKGYLLLNDARCVSEQTFVLWTRRAVPAEGDLILAREAPVGNVAIVPAGQKVCLGQRTVLLRPNRDVVDSHILLRILLSDFCQNAFTGASSGVTVAHLNLRDLRRLVIPVPSRSLQAMASLYLRPLDSQITQLFRQIARLTKARDLLLPRLMNGEISV